MSTARDYRAARLWRVWPVLLCAAVSVALGQSDGSAGKVPDDELSRRLIGTWEDEYQGHRTFIVRTNGTATMIVQLKGWKAAFYASRLQFEMTWVIEDGLLKKHTTGGEPPGKVRTVLRMMGDRVEERILELTSDRLLLLDPDGKKRYDWRRAASIPP